MERCQRKRIKGNSQLIDDYNRCRNFDFCIFNKAEYFEPKMLAIIALFILLGARLAVVTKGAFRLDAKRREATKI